MKAYKYSVHELDGVVPPDAPLFPPEKPDGLPTQVYRCSAGVHVRGKRGGFMRTCAKSLYYVGFGTVQAQHPYWGRIGWCCGKNTPMEGHFLMLWPEIASAGEPYDPAEVFPDEAAEGRRWMRHALSETPAPKKNGLVRQDGSGWA